MTLLYVIIAVALVAAFACLILFAVFRKPPVAPAGPAILPTDRASYLAALFATMVIIPIVALLCSTVFYFARLSLIFWRSREGAVAKDGTPLSNAVSDKVVNSVNVVASFLIAALIWFMVAWWWQRFTTISRANPHIYSDITIRFADLLASIDAIVAPDAASSPLEREAYAIALRHQAILSEELATVGGDLRWIRATGYTRLWDSVHRIEEALIMLEPTERVIAEARYDELRLKDSTITASDDLLMTLRTARTGLGVAPFPGTQAPAPPVTRLQGRAFLSQVRYSINEFRADRWSGLVRARNHLLATGLYTGLATNLLLGLVIIAVPNQDANGRHDVITAAILFFVGAIVGLFNRLYLDALADDVIEDYGLSTARLMMTPLFSGLAAVGGVLITILLPGVLADVVPTATPSATARPAITATATPSGTATPTAPTVVPTAMPTVAPTRPGTPSGTPTISATTPDVNLPAGKTARLTDVFDINRYPFELVIAAIFALTPGLLISKLQRQTEGYKADLSSTEASQQTARRGG